MSDIPLARTFLLTALKEGDMDDNTRRWIKHALRLMTRESPVRRAPAKKQRITDKQKAAARLLKYTNLTMHEIANKVGIANGGRVSEIMTGKR
jgi:hypothetical protein